MFIYCIIGLLRVQGVDSMCAEIDQLLEFMHFPMISLEYGEARMIDLSCGKIFIVHEQLEVISSDQGNRFHSACWQELLIFVGTGLTPSTSFYPQSDGQEEMLNQQVERYLHEYEISWIEWLHLGENYCETTHDILQTTKTHQRMHADRNRVDQIFEIGDMVFLRVKPHRSSPLIRGVIEKMIPCL
jgi:hypothetical protein